MSIFNLAASGAVSGWLDLRGAAEPFPFWISANTTTIVVEISNDTVASATKSDAVTIATYTGTVLPKKIRPLLARFIRFRQTATGAATISVGRSRNAFGQQYDLPVQETTNVPTGAF